MAFVRTKRGQQGRTLLQLVASRRERGQVRQAVLAHLGSYPADCSVPRAAAILRRDFQRWQARASACADRAETLREGRRVPPPGRHAPTWARQYHRARRDVERYQARLAQAAKRYATLRAHCAEWWVDATKRPESGRLAALLRRLAPGLAAALARVRDVRDLPRGLRLAIADVLDDERVGLGLGRGDAYGRELEALVESLGLDE